LWDRTEAGPAELGAVTVGGEVWDVAFSIDDDVVYVNEQIGDLARVRAIDLGEGSTVAQADFGAGAGFVYPVTTPAGLVAGWAPGGQSRVEDLSTGDVIARLSPCDVPGSIDAAGRWLLVSRGLLMADFIADSGCRPGTSRVLDPQTGDVLLELPDDVVLSDIGPPGTISDGLIAYQSSPGSDEPAPLVIRDLRSGELVGRLTTFSPWRPVFSNDGRYIASGSAEDGGIAIDVEQVLAGASADDAIVANPRLEGATTFPVVVGDYLVTGHAGEMLRFWRLTDRQQELALPVNSGDSTFLAPTPDDRYLYYEDEGHLLRRFPLDVAELVELAKRRVQRGFRADECERYELADDCESFVASQ
jgi:WD40 repeat protein